MTTDLPNGPRGRMLALALTATALLAVWFGVAAPVIQWHESRTERLAGRKALARHMARVATELPQLRRELAATAANGAPPITFFAGDTDAIAGAALQDLVEDLAKKAGADLSSAEMLPSESAGAYRRVSVHVRVYTRAWPILIHLLQSLERARPRMLLDDVQIHALPARDKQEGPPIDSSFTVVGFRAAAPGAPPR
jgi:general secretion pathway protein M